MITVRCWRNRSNAIQKIAIDGHALSGPYGQDLVCAAVSAISTGTLNALAPEKNVTLVQRDGYAEIALKGRASETVTIVLETMFIQLKTVQQSHPKNVKIITNKEE